MDTMREKRHAHKGAEGRLEGRRTGGGAALKRTKSRGASVAEESFCAWLHRGTLI